MEVLAGLYEQYKMLLAASRISELVFMTNKKIYSELKFLIYNEDQGSFSCVL